ncbi:rho GTPase-activating protein 27 isoform X2 [Drosophila montana]|uniref:rho GTPase-activating protein 27 isoform X2 n=1 Tax=Drosophila montana TaxID=40370 RepID=UPI00313D4199
MQAGASSNGPVTPGSPDSAHIIIGAAGYVAHERRQPHPPKRLMNCFRDRSTTTASSAQYARSHSSTATALLRLESSAGSIQALDQAGIAAGGGAGRPEAVVLLRELRTKPNKLTLLKSSSTRDLTRLLLDESSSATAALLVSNGSLDMCSSNASSAGSPAQGRDRNGSRECCTVCGRRWHQLKQRMHTLELDLQAQASYSQELEQKLADLSRQLAELLQEKRQPTTAAAAAAFSSSYAGKRHGGGGAPVRPSRLAAWMNLANWWKSRPSVETLREQRIFFDEPCFDTELELVLKHDQHRTVPRILIDCCDLIEQMYRRSAQPVEGIYRQCGDYNKIQTLRFNIDANDYDALRRPGVDIHTLTGVLKLFLREIKSPLISVNEANTFIGPPNQWLLTEQNQKLDTLKRLIRSLPEINRDTMDYLFGHFNRLTKVPLQQISAETLSISITPSIFHTVAQGVHMNDIQELLREGETLADCVRLMIEYHARIFECTADRRLKRLSVRNLKKTLSQPDLLFHNLF